MRFYANMPFFINLHICSDFNIPATHFHTSTSPKSLASCMNSFTFRSSFQFTVHRWSLKKLIQVQSKTPFHKYSYLTSTRLRDSGKSTSTAPYLLPSTATHLHSSFHDRTSNFKYRYVLLYCTLKAHREMRNGKSINIG